MQDQADAGQAVMTGPGRRAARGAGRRSARRVRCAGWPEPGANPQVVCQLEVVEELLGLLPGPGGGWQVTGSPAGIAEVDQQAGQPSAGQRSFPSACEGQGLLVAADRPVLLAEPGVDKTQGPPRNGEARRVACLGDRFQGLPGVAARQLVVPQLSVALTEDVQGPSLPGLDAGLAEKRPGLF